MSETILIVDDEADIRTFLSVALKKHGFQTLTAANGKEGLRLAKEHKPALVVMDIMMPRQSGTDLHRALMEDEDLCDVPVIVVSGLTGEHLSPRPPAARFDKPVDPAAFVAAVKQALGA